MRNRILILVVGTTISWSLLVGILSGLYHAGKEIAALVREPPRDPSSHQSDHKIAVPRELEDLADELSDISPAAGPHAGREATPAEIEPGDR